MTNLEKYIDEIAETLKNVCQESSCDLCGFEIVCHKYGIRKFTKKLEYIKTTKNWLSEEFKGD